MKSYRSPTGCERAACWSITHCQALLGDVPSEQRGNQSTEEFQPGDRSGGTSTVHPAAESLPWPRGDARCREQGSCWSSCKSWGFQTRSSLSKMHWRAGWRSSCLPTLFIKTTRTCQTVVDKRLFQKHLTY